MGQTAGQILLLSIVLQKKSKKRAEGPLPEGGGRSGKQAGGGMARGRGYDKVGGGNDTP